MDNQFFANLRPAEDSPNPEMEAFYPIQTSSVTFEESDTICPRIKEKSYREKLDEFENQLSALRKEYAPFLRDYAPEVSGRASVRLDTFRFRYEGEEDRADFSRVLHGLGEWQEVKIPDYRGPVGKWTGYYRKEFRYQKRACDKRVFLKFLGVDYIANVYLNARCVGSHTGFFAPFEFDVTDFLSEDGENTIVVEVKNDIPTVGLEDVKLNGDKIYACTGLGWDDPADGWHHCPPGAGIYNEVLLEERGRIFIDSIFARPDIDQSLIHLQIGLNSTYAENHPVKASYRIYSRNFRGDDTGEIPLTDIEPAGPGMNIYNLTVEKEKYRLWSTDEPWLYSIRVFLHGDDGPVADERESVFGMRKFHMDKESELKGSLFLNNRPIVLRGANDMGHMQQCVLKNDRNQLIDDILIAKAANMNYYRFTQRPVQSEIYLYCDMLGMLNQTDFPLFGYLRKNLVCEAIRQTEEMEKHIRNHPSCIMISYINEPFPVKKAKLEHRHLERTHLEDFFEAADIVVGIANPDRVIKHVEGDYEPPTRDGLSDFHSYNLWYNNHGLAFGKMYKGFLPPMKKGWKTGCGEYGTEGLDSMEVMDTHYPGSWLKSFGEKWTPEKIVQSQTYAMHGDWYEEQNDRISWIRQSQKHQAFATKMMTDAWRRRTDRVVSTAIHLLIDAWPAGWMKALVGVDRVPKPAYFSFREALEPIRISLRCDTWKLYEGKTAHIEVWIMNDTASELEGCKMSATLRDDKRDYSSYEMHDVKIPPVSAYCIGNIRAEIPSIANRKQLFLDAYLETGGGETVNSERFSIEAFESHDFGQYNVCCIGDGAVELCDGLNIRYGSFLKQGPENLCFVVSDTGEYEKNRSSIEEAVYEGAAAVFLEPDAPERVWAFADTSTQYSPISEGNYCEGVAEDAKGIFFVARAPEHVITGIFKAEDFSYWYNAENGMIDYISANYIECDKLEPLLYTYKKPEFSQNQAGEKQKMPVAGIMRHGKGSACFLSLYLKGRCDHPVVGLLMKQIFEQK